MLTRFPPALSLLVIGWLAACQPRPEGAAPSDESARGATAAHTVRLSADERAPAGIRRCLANASGAVPRFTDDEPFAAVDPRDANRVIVVWQTRSGEGSVIQFARSSDGGRTWSTPQAAPINACAGGPVSEARLSSDPWTTFGPDGRAYLSALAWTPSPDDGPDAISALVVVASPDGGSTWEAPVAAAVAPSRTISHDNLAITADPTRPGTVYAATTRAEQPGPGRYYGRLGFTRTEDGGKTWTPIRAITPAFNGERIGAPQILVDPRSGRLYAVYHRSRAGLGFIGVMTSDDGGETWSAEATAARHVRGSRTLHPLTGRRFVLALDIVQAAISPVTAELVIAYADARLDSARKSVSVVRSRDGRQWSKPMDVSLAASNSAWLPAIAFQRDGDLAVSYFVADFSPGGEEPAIEVMIQRLRRDSTELTPLEAMELRAAKLEWPGDYQGLVASGDAFLAVYGQETDIFATRIPDRE